MRSRPPSLTLRCTRTVSPGENGTMFPFLYSCSTAANLSIGSVLRIQVHSRRCIIAHVIGSNHRSLALGLDLIQHAAVLLPQRIRGEQIRTTRQGPPQPLGVPPASDGFMIA